MPASPLRNALPIAAAAAAVTVCLAAACATAGDQVSPNGYRYEYRTDVPGPTVQSGEVGYFHFAMMKGDSVIVSSREQSDEPQPFVVPEDSVEVQGGANIIVDALRLMSVGDSLSIYLSLDTIEQRPPGFGPEDELRYDITLADIKDLPTYQAEEERRNAALRARLERYAARESVVADSTASILAEYARGASRAGFTTTASGLKYKILEAGTGPQAEVGKPVLVSYYGVLVDGGEMFDNSFRAGKPFDFPLGKGAVIPGWDEGIALLREGARAVLAIPSDLAYGDNPRPGGPIPPGAELLFYVQLEEVAR